MAKVLTLGEFIVEKQGDFKYATGELTRLLSSIRLAAKVVNAEVNKAGLTEDILGAAGNENVQGEEQMKLDVYADNVFINALKKRGVVCGVASEENDDYIAFEGDNTDSQYVVLIDPLDGSSNIDVNVSIGTIFSIYRRISEGSSVKVEDFLQKGTEQVAAGYVVYGSSTMIVYSTGNGVNGFTYDPTVGVFYLSHPDMKIPANGTIYSVNEGNLNSLSAGVRAYITQCQDQGMSARYIGSLVADFHRNLIKGGIYMYPATEKAPKGKLRLLYELNPMAYLTEQAGGKASSGTERIMDIQPTELHQRAPVFMGSSEMVDAALACLKEHEAANV